MPDPFISYAQNREDVMLWRALGHVTDGFYIDVGAGSPTIASVTHALYDRGWHGINIEPLPAYFRDLVTERPRDINLQIAVGDRPGSLTLHAVDDTGFSTLVPEEARRRAEEGWGVSDVHVAVDTLNVVWPAHVPAGQAVHFLKVDVEGYEREVLEGIDLGVLRPWVLVLEAMRPNSQEPAHAAWEPLVTRAGYALAYADGLNRFYLADEHRDLAERFAYPPNVFDGYVTATEAEALARAARAEGRAARAEAELAAVMASRSWRLTAPLRSASGVARRARRAPESTQREPEEGTR